MVLIHAKLENQNERAQAKDIEHLPIDVKKLDFVVAENCCL